MGLLLNFLFVACSASTDTLVILHTNDTHSQIEPIAAGKRDGNCAGYARRMGFIQQEREANPNLILLDAGDFCQGTPYFNFYRGRMEVEAFNRMGYDAVTLGNHEFDKGAALLQGAIDHAQFPIVCANIKSNLEENQIFNKNFLYNLTIRVFSGKFYIAKNAFSCSIIAHTFFFS